MVWKKIFYLESIHVGYEFFNDCVFDENQKFARSASIRIYERDKCICRGHILHYLPNSLLDIYILWLKFYKRNLGGSEKVHGKC